MISATSLSSAPSPHNSLAKSVPGIPLGLENGLRVDSQKFLVPSLPISSGTRSLGNNNINNNNNNNNDPSFRKRSRLAGPLHHQQHHHQQHQYDARGYLNGIRGPYNMEAGPLKEIHSPAFNGEVNGPRPSSFPPRSAVPIPCSSPSPAASASPNKSHSPSSYPQFSPELNSSNSGRIYGGFHALPPPHSSSNHLSPYYPSHSLPYPMFGTHSYNPHSGGGYLEIFHPSNLIGAQALRTAASPPRRPASSLPQSSQASSQLSPPENNRHPTSSSTNNSLHNQLMEASSDRYAAIHAHHNNHLNNHHQHHQHLTEDNLHQHHRFAGPQPGTPAPHLNVPSSPSHLQFPHHPHHHHHHNNESSNDRSPVSISSRPTRNTPAILSPKWSPSRVSNGGDNAFFPKDMDQEAKCKEAAVAAALKHHQQQQHLLRVPTSEDHQKSIHYLSCKDTSERSLLGQEQQQQRKPTTPASPNKRTGSHWNFGGQSKPEPLSDSVKYLTSKPSVGGGNDNKNKGLASPKFILTPPASSTAQSYYFQFPPTSNSISFLSSSEGPSGTCSMPSTPTKIPHTPTKVPHTPTMPHTPTIPKTPTNKSKQLLFIEPNSSSPVRMEKLPLIEAFHRGALTQLPTGELRRVEDLNMEDFLSAAASLADSIAVTNCTVISIHLDASNTLCKVILTVGSENQQVIVEASAEQPFFVIGRGWSSSSPARTEQKLRLPCGPLTVGDVCITLRRKDTKNPPGIMMTKVTKAAQGPRPRGRPSGPGRPRGRLGSTTTTAAGKCSTVPGNSPSSAMLPPPAPSQSQPTKLDGDDDDDDVEVSDAKKRRWSAPEETIEDEQDESSTV